MTESWPRNIRTIEEGSFSFLFWRRVDLTRAKGRSRVDGGILFAGSLSARPLRTRRDPSERLRLVSKPHLTLTWGGVMNQHDLRFAEPCSCLIESSVAHPAIPESYLYFHVLSRKKRPSIFLSPLSSFLLLLGTFGRP